MKEVSCWNCKHHVIERHEDYGTYENWSDGGCELDEGSCIHEEGEPIKKDRRIMGNLDDGLEFRCSD